MFSFWYLFSTPGGPDEPFLPTNKWTRFKTLFLRFGGDPKVVGSVTMPTPEGVLGPPPFFFLDTLFIGDCVLLGV